MEQFQHLKIQWEEITLATNNFDEKNFIGSGGFGKVYEGSLARYKERSLVAFKRLDRKHDQGGAEFLKEIVYLTNYTHKNIVSLLGYCIHEKEMILVYEHASRGSLDSHLNSADLTWTQRLNICLDVANGLNHLHDPRETEQRLIHCDVKSSNILLNDEWNAKVADFGLSKIAPANQHNSILITNHRGTPGYVDPLFMETYLLTKESDVYSFGVVLFEVLCGRLCFEKTNGQFTPFVPMCKKSYKENKLDDIIFPDLRQNMDQTSLKTFSDIAYQCLKNSREERPLMSLVVKTLETALQCQVMFQNLKLLGEYEEIVNGAVPPPTCNAKEEVKALLSKGLLVNGGTMWVSMNENEQNIQLTSIKECLILDGLGTNSDQYYSHEYNSSFEVGTYNTHCESFKTRVRSQFLSPYITYAVNLIFKYPRVLEEKPGKQQYISLRYKLNEGERKISIVDVGEKREDEWLISRLHHFTTSHRQSIVELEIEFDRHENRLEIEGIQFQPLLLEFNNVVVEQDDDLDDDDDEKKKYQEIVKSAEPPLLYTSLHQLKLLLSKGLHLNSGNTWFYLNDKGQHCELISIKHCIIPDKPEKDHLYVSHYNSRFLVGTYDRYSSKIKVRVRAQFLTPLITYTVNLVFKFDKYVDEEQPKQPYIGLRYKLGGETRNSVSYFADKREDEWWMVELCQFTTEGTTTADLEIIFQNSYRWMAVEGIEFLPVELENEEDQVLEDDDHSQQPISPDDSDSVDTYWEQKLPNDYEDVIKLAKHSVPMNTTKKDLYLIFSQGFQINNGQEWFSLDKNGKKWLMLSARAAIIASDLKRQSLPKSRFGEALALTCWDFKIVSEIKSHMLESETRYATYLVYRLPESGHGGVARILSSWKLLKSDQSNFKYRVKVMDGKDHCYVYLAGLQIPVTNVKGKVDGNTRNPLNRPKLNGIPKERSDGWMEVKVWEFQTPTTPTIEEIIPMRLQLDMSNRKKFGTFIIQGIEFRPIYIG